MRRRLNPIEQVSGVATNSEPSSQTFHVDSDVGNEKMNIELRYGNSRSPQFPRNVTSLEYTFDQRNSQEKSKKISLVKGSSGKFGDDWKAEGAEYDSSRTLSRSGKLSSDDPEDTLKSQQTDVSHYSLSGQGDCTDDEAQVNQSSEAFPQKLYRILEQADTDGTDIVSFFPNGRAFAIHKPKKFVSEIMPKYFSTGRMSSFQRQLNLYGFRRITDGEEKGGYFHEKFQKGKKDLCAEIKRKKSGVKLPPNFIFGGQELLSHRSYELERYRNEMCMRQGSLLQSLCGVNAGVVTRQVPRAALVAVHAQRQHEEDLSNRRCLQEVWQRQLLGQYVNHGGTRISSPNLSLGSGDEAVGREPRGGLALEAVSASPPGIIHPFLPNQGLRLSHPGQYLRPSSSHQELSGMILDRRLQPPTLAAILEQQKQHRHQLLVAQIRRDTLLQQIHQTQSLRLEPGGNEDLFDRKT